MKFWPVPDSYSKAPPENGAPGSFWENRGDRHHCGVDIYAPKSAEVLAIEAGDVAKVAVFTSPELVPYWTITYYILIRHQTGLISKYAELGDVVVTVGEAVKPGQVIGRVGSVLNSEKITDDSPLYIQKLKQNANQSMLHFELYKDMPASPDNYIGGNIFDSSMPKNLLDCTVYLKTAMASIDR